MARPGSALSSFNTYPSGSIGEPEVAALTRTVPLVATQLTVKFRSAVEPIVTVTGRGFAPSIAQFPAAPASWMVCPPAGIPVKVTLPAAAIGRPGSVLSNLATYPSGSVGDPEVVTVTRMVPLVAEQSSVKFTSVVVPLVIVTGRGLTP
jgi:hypothetical protein